MFKGVVKGSEAFSILVTAFRRVNQAYDIYDKFIHRV